MSCNCNKNLSGLGAINTMCQKYPEMCANAGSTTAQVNPRIALMEKERAMVNTDKFKDANVIREESSIPSWVLPVAGVGAVAIILYMITK